jgi:peptide-methionine (R)-S-oxide reductase
MTREQFLGSLLSVVAIPLAACSQPTALGDVSGRGGPGPTEPDPNPKLPELQKTEAEWRALLSPAAYAILFEGRTELPGSSPLASEHRDGTYVCAACFLPLFQSTAKYDSGTGWPSFWEPIGTDRVGYSADHTLSELRTEYHCSRCGGHDGHVFTDGPPPTGLRYCNNGLALRFVPKGQVLPDLRD